VPELPEVETIARQLNEVLVGKIVSQMTVYREKIFSGDKDVLIGKKITKVSRRAKVVGVEFEGFEDVVQIHLKMTGQLIFVEKTKKTQELKTDKTQVFEKRVAGGHPSVDWTNDLPSKHTRVEIIFDDDSVLFFNDMRAFGWVKITNREEREKQASSLPPDVIDESFTLDYFAQVLKKSKKPIKLVLLDQQLMGGIGNIYANDALNMAKILPTRKACDLNVSEARKLYKAVRYVIELGIKCGGASAANYVDTKGLGGTYQNHFLTYKRDGEPCNNCGEKILKVKLGGRGTFYCPNCQV